MKRIDVAYSLITDKDKTKILMVKNHKNGTWSLPGGGVEESETLDAAAIREAKEETGFDIKVHGVVAINEAILTKHDEHVVFITFRAEIIGGQQEITRPSEISHVEWVDIDRADEFMPYYQEGLKNIVKNEIEIKYFNEGKV
ncbi:NUDIX hydrolase [Paenibacillus lautus]|uniref:NUDIX hydrolase n=1 Tax=Paenibacillus lautus TaxID=1401 RepID=UPI000BBD5AB7|nr:NUDIX hydrolase [Paenibacillus lautus]PCL91578.1 phosphohydrolase [Paenibacillus lautus]